MESKDVAMLIAQAADERKADDVKILDIRKITLIADYFVIASAPNSIRVRAIAEAIETKTRELDTRPLHREGYDAGRWVLLDYSDVIVHVFHEEERKFYDLERLWGDAEVMDVSGQPDLTSI